MTWIFFSQKSTRLMTTDLKAAHYVLFNSYDYQKLTMVRNFIRNLFGSGVFLLFINCGIPDHDVTTILYRTSKC